MLVLKSSSKLVMHIGNRFHVSTNCGCIHVEFGSLLHGVLLVHDHVYYSIIYVGVHSYMSIHVDAEIILCLNNPLIPKIECLACTSSLLS